VSANFFVRSFQFVSIYQRRQRRGRLRKEDKSQPKANPKRKMNPLIKRVIIIFILLAHCLVTYSVETETCTNPDCAGVRVISEEELKTYEN